MLAVLSDPELDLGLGMPGSGATMDATRNPVLESEAVFVDLPSVFGELSRAPLLSPRGFVRDVYKSLKFCDKGQERGATEQGTFVGDTKLGRYCKG